MIRLFVILLFVVFLAGCFSKQKLPDNPVEQAQEERGDIRVMFYNVENLYDTFDDSLTDDSEFQPEGDRHWTPFKMQDKIKNIAKVITAVGGWDPPEIIGMCEIENRYVLEQLTDFSPIADFGYKIIHYDSPDGRGIDVALLYLEKKFKPIHQQKIEISFPGSNERKTRDILYVKGLANNQDTLHVFINHWPSRLGGQLESESKRLFVASVLKAKTDSIFKSNPCSNIIITGDFNDEPENKSLNDVLEAKREYADIKENNLYNISFSLQEKGLGSHKFQGTWGMLDQFVVSGCLLKKKEKGLSTSLENVHVFSRDYLMEPDEKNTGTMPKRTFVGFKYNQGFSDHLPVYLDLKLN